jgi:hypothetical protein
MPADLQTSVPTPPFPAGSEELKSFNYLNDFRKASVWVCSPIRRN